MRKWLIIILLAVIMPEAFTANQYINDVLEGKQIVCKWVRLAVERHVNDLKRQQTEGFPYYFDEEAAKRVITFKQFLKHTKGEWAKRGRVGGNYLKLEPWQQFINWALFGWKREDGSRRFAKAYITMARKNGKTTEAAGTGLYCCFADSPFEYGAEGYCAATKEAQARIWWDEAYRQVLTNPALSKKIRLKTNSIYIPGTASKFVPLGQDSKTEDGLNPHFGGIDEYHAHPTDGMVNVLQTGMGARKQPLLYIITTAGFDINSPCHLEQEKAQKVLEGSIVDENYFTIIYTLDEGDDFTNPACWIKANPNLGVSVYEHYLQQQVTTALTMPSEMNKIKTKNFNVWTQTSEAWVNHEDWLKNCITFDEGALLGRECYGGLDLSTNIDITAYVLCFPPKFPDEKYKFLYRFFLPELDIRQRSLRDRVDYETWAKAGLIILTPGNCIDYDYVENVIKTDIEKYDLRQIAFDPWKCEEIRQHIQSFGPEMIPVRQQMNPLGVQTFEFEKAMMKADLATNNNPVMTWMMTCTEIYRDQRGNSMPIKPKQNKTGKHIDGVIASIMSYYLARSNQISIYESEGVFVI